MATKAADLPQAVHERIEAQDSKLVNETINIATLKCKSEVKNLKNDSGEGENFLNLPSMAEGANNGSPDAYEVMEKPDQTNKDACDIQEEKSKNQPVATKETSSEETQQKPVELSTSLDKVEDTQVKFAVDSADATSVKSEPSHGVREEQIKDKEDEVNPMIISKSDDIETRKMDKEHDTTDGTIKTSQEVNDDSKITIKANDIETQTKHDTTILSEATADEPIKMTEVEDAHANEDVDNIILSDVNRILEEKVAQGRKDIAEIPSQEEGGSNQVHDGCIDNSEAKDNVTVLTAGFPCEEENERREPDTEASLI